MSGQERTLDELITHYGRRVTQLLSRLLPVEADREDALQETWLALLRQPGGERPAWSYVRRTALSKAIDRLRRRACAPLPEDGPLAPPERDRGAPSLPLHRLPANERRALELRFWCGLAIEEIAETLEVPVGTVKTWLHRGRRRLRELLTHPEDHHETL